jgi:hypothetical protein
MDTSILVGILGILDPLHGSSWIICSHMETTNKSKSQKLSNLSLITSFPIEPSYYWYICHALVS